MAETRREIAVIATLPDDVRAALGRRFALVEHILEGPGATPLSSLPARFRVIATRALLGVPAGICDALPDLDLVLSLGAGLEKIDTTDLEARGIALAYTADQFTEDVADFALGLIYAAQRNIVGGDRFVRSGAWEKARFKTGRRVSSRRVGIVGLGRIGMRIAEKCNVLGMTVAYHSRTRRADQPFAFHGDIRDLASASDILVLACAESDHTRGMVGREVLDALGPNGILVNVARGAVVDEEALIDALGRKALGAAALDVFAAEPSIDPRFLQLDNVILSPHAATFTHEARQAVIDHLVEAAESYFENAD
jgi:lactate dehydrogenase-like 2-hydroxyacid dehydrogenase